MKPFNTRTTRRGNKKAKEVKEAKEVYGKRGCDLLLLLLILILLFSDTRYFFFKRFVQVSRTSLSIVCHFWWILDGFIAVSGVFTAHFRLVWGFLAILSHSNDNGGQYPWGTDLYFSLILIFHRIWLEIPLLVVFVSLYVDYLAGLWFSLPPAVSNLNTKVSSSSASRYYYYCRCYYHRYCYSAGIWFRFDVWCLQSFPNGPEALRVAVHWPLQDPCPFLLIFDLISLLLWFYSSEMSRRLADSWRFLKILLWFCRFSSWFRCFYGSIRLKWATDWRILEDSCPFLLIFKWIRVLLRLKRQSRHANKKS